VTSDAGCDCIKRIQEALRNDKASNTQLDIGIRINLQTGEELPYRVKIATCKKDSKNRQKALFFSAVFCPFCGEKYP
jgi:hypothetical protein